MGLNHNEALDRINAIAKEDSPLQVIKQELFDVLSMTNKDAYEQVLNGVISSYVKSTSYLERRNLSFASPFVHSLIKGKTDKPYDDEKDNGGNGEKDTDKNAGTVTLIRENDSTGNYLVYKYTIKKWGYPKDVIKKYKEQIGGKTDGIKITDVNGKEYQQDTKFTMGTNVYIKVPKEKPLNLDYLNGLDEDTKEKIAIQEKYLDKQSLNQKETLEKFNKQHPMGKDVEISFGIPVKEYEDIEKTLASITTNQTLDPKRYEVVVLLNRPNNKIEFDKKTKEKILKFQLAHPEYNIHLFEHTFNFPEGERVNMGEIYKLLGDTIAYRNVQRKNIKGMDMQKIRNLIIKRGASDSTDKHPDYLKHQLECYSHDYEGKELVRLAGESRIPVDLAQTYPLIEIDEFFQRYYDLEYAHGDPLKRDVGLGSYKARCYCGIGGTNPVSIQEDTSFVRGIKSYVAEHKGRYCMYYDKDFIGAVDNSTDRGICSIVKGVPYCEKYSGGFKKGDKTKKIEWNNWAIKNKGKPETQCLELTTKNLERDISAFYLQRFNRIVEKPSRSAKYSKYLASHKGISELEKQERVLNNIINPIMIKVLSKPDFMGLDTGDYELQVKINSKGKITPSIKFNGSAITKIKQAQQQRIADGYYDYRK